jgi:hypothetical protein
MLERNLRHRFLGLACVLASACTQSGTETDNPITEFRSSECKGSSSETALSIAGLDSEAGGALTSADTANRMAGPEYDGLFCVAWDTGDDGALSIELYNLSGGCHVVWGAQAQRESGGFALELQPHNCVIAGCGSCTYDLGFELHGFDSEAPLPFVVRELSCSDSPDTAIVEMELPLDARKEGVICRPQPRASSGLRTHCGGAHLQVCGEEEDEVAQCGDANAPACAGGLVCEPGEPDVCLTACEQDHDCPLAIERCDAGACRLRETL